MGYLALLMSHLSNVFELTCLEEVKVVTRFP